MTKESYTENNPTWQCMGCALRVESEEAPEECPKCHSQLSFAKVADWRFF